MLDTVLKSFYGSLKTQWNKTDFLIFFYHLTNEKDLKKKKSTETQADKKIAHSCTAECSSKSFSGQIIVFLIIGIIDKDLPNDDVIPS